MMPVYSDSESLKDLPDSDISYHREFIDAHGADQLFDYLTNHVVWQTDTIKLFGKTYPQPRLTALYGNNGKSYTYSNITMNPIPFDDILEDLKRKTSTNRPS